MKSSRTLVILVAVLLIGGLAGTAISQAVFNPVRVAFADVPRIFKEYKATKEVEQQTRDQLRALNMRLRASYEKLQKRQSELDVLIPGTQDYVDTKRELDFEAFKLDYEEKQEKQKILEEAATRMNLAYTAIRRAAENYARRNGLDAVFMVNDKEIDTKTLDQLEVVVATRPVLYWNKGYDITQTIIAELNK